MEPATQKSAGYATIVFVLVSLFVAGSAITTNKFHRSLKTSNQLWACAVLHSLPSKGVNPNLADSFYRKAIRQNPSSAELLVAYGDFLRGPMPVSLEWNQTFDDVEEVERFTEEPESIEEFANDIFSIIDGDDLALAQYNQAMLIAPDSALARFRMAVYGTGSRSEKAAAWLTHNCLDNALGPCLQAANAIQHNPSDVMILVQEANKRKSLRLFDDPVPEATGVKFPKFFRHYTGKNVPVSVLRAMVERQNTWFEFRDPLRRKFESVLDHLVELVQSDSANEANAAMIAHHALCYQLVFNDSYDMLLALSAIFRYEESFEFIEKRLESDSFELIAARQRHTRIDHFKRLIRETWIPENAAISELSEDDLFTGRVDPFAMHRELVKQMQTRSLQAISE